MEIFVWDVYIMKIGGNNTHNAWKCGYCSIDRIKVVISENIIKREGANMLPYSKFAFIEWTFDKSSLQRTKNEQ